MFKLIIIFAVRPWVVIISITKWNLDEQNMNHRTKITKPACQRFVKNMSIKNYARLFVNKEKIQKVT